MGGAVTDKILAPLGGKPVFAHSAATFYRSGVVDFFVVTYRDQRQLVELSAYAPTPTVFVRGDTFIVIRQANFPTNGLLPAIVGEIWGD